MNEEFPLSGLFFLFFFSISNSLCCKYVICLSYLCRNLQKKCHTLNKGSHRASAGKYVTSLISRYTLWRLCPSFDLPKRFLSSCLPKFPASSTSFSTNLPYFSLGGTIRREACHAEHLLHDIHDSPGKIPQSQLLQFLLQGS